MESDVELLREEGLVGRELLKRLEQTQKYIFHGSRLKLDTLEPRQAYRFDHETLERTPDGPPAVFASPYSEPPIFMSLIQNTEPGEWSGWSPKGEGAYSYRATKASLDRAGQAKGFVHVFDRKEFERNKNGEWVSYKEVKPITIVEVTAQDLPEEITIVKPKKTE